MVFCRECGKKETRNLSIDTFTSVCQKCTTLKNAAAVQQGIPTEITDEAKLSDISFQQFKSWIQYVIQDTIQSEVQMAMQKCAKDIEAVKKDLGLEKEKVATLITKVNSLTTELTELKNEHVKTKKVGEENLKYLINLDRNSRKHNIMVFGLPEGKDLVFKDENGDEISRASDDNEKVSAVLDHLNSDISGVSHFHRLGKPGAEDKPRPVKVIFKAVTQAQIVLSNSKKLNEWEERIYVKADKTKSEANEFKRIGRRKEELLLQHPTTDPENPIVTLAKGVLKVNGTEVDRYNPIQSLF